MRLKQQWAGVLALAMMSWFATATAAEKATDAATAFAPPLPLHLPGSDNAVSPSPNGTPGSDGYLFVAGSAFSPRGSTGPTTYAGAGCIKATEDFVVTDLQLPHGTTVFGVRAYYYVNDASAAIVAGVTRYDGAGAATDLVIKQSAGSGGYVDEYFPMDTPEVIDNYEYSYVLIGKTGGTAQLCGMRVYFQYP